MKPREKQATEGQRKANYPLFWDSKSDAPQGVVGSNPMPSAFVTAFLLTVSVDGDFATDWLPRSLFGLK